MLPQRLIISLFLFIVIPVLARENGSNCDGAKYKAVHAAIFATPYYVAYNINYEFSLRERPSVITSLRLGFAYYELGYSIPVSGVTIVYLKTPHHIEFNYGLNVIVKEQTTILPWPVLNAGYRYQKFNQNSFIFRVGLGLEYIGPYVGVGYAF